MSKSSAEEEQSVFEMDDVQEGDINLEVEVPDFNSMSIDEAHEITGDGSITPSTHKYQRTVFLDGGDEIFRTEYEYVNSQTGEIQSHAVRFGINTYNLGNSSQVKLEKINPIDIKCDSTVKSLSKLSDPNLNKKAKTKINTKILEEKDKFCSFVDEAKAKISSYEEKVLTQAIEYLDKGKSKSVLLDIFDRSSDELEIHTVVLYKQCNNEYVVIDPNRSTHSHILMYDSRLICCPDKFELYNPESGNTGRSEKTQSRDCIDIAVKIAFHLEKDQPKFDIATIEFNQTETLRYIDKKVFVNNYCLSKVSNKSGELFEYPAELEFNAFRGKQSSNVELSEEIDRSLKVIQTFKKKFQSKIDEFKNLPKVYQKLQHFLSNKINSIYENIESLLPEEHLKQEEKLSHIIKCIDVANCYVDTLDGKTVKSLGENQDVDVTWPTEG